MKYKLLFSLILICSILGLIASFVLTLETIEIAKNANYIPRCTLNSVFNCATVMKTKEAEILGFPNSLLGIVGYSISATFAAICLLGNYRDRSLQNKYIYLGFNLGIFLAVLFSYWLISLSVFKTGALCIYCLISLFAITTIFFAITHFNLKEGFINLNETFYKFIKKNYHIPVIVLWYCLVAGVIIFKFIN
jgi:uncharacterized membrane protein